MAYSDYGGYAYRNGEHIEDRSDAVLSPEGIKSTPGMWPGWVLPEGRSGGSYHALLGDGPIFVGLYKQSSLMVFRLGEQLDLVDLMVNAEDGAIEEYKNARYVNEDHFKSSEEPCVFKVDGHTLTVYWRIQDNHYQYVKLEQPDGTIWTGFSGYGVGAGLEDAGYGYDTDDCVATLYELFPKVSEHSLPVTGGEP